MQRWRPWRRCPRRPPARRWCPWSAGSSRTRRSCMSACPKRRCWCCRQCRSRTQPPELHSAPPLGSRPARCTRLQSCSRRRPLCMSGWWRRHKSCRQLRRWPQCRAPSLRRCTPCTRSRWRPWWRCPRRALPNRRRGSCRPRPPCMSALSRRCWCCRRRQRWRSRSAPCTRPQCRWCLTGHSLRPPWCTSSCRCRRQHRRRRRQSSGSRRARRRRWSRSCS